MELKKSLLELPEPQLNLQGVMIQHVLVTVTWEKQQPGKMIY